MDISFITVNYNSSKETLELVRSIEKMTSKTLTYEIIVVDNASEPEEFKLLEPLENHAHIRLVRSRINTGFAQGNMLGIQYAKGEYYFFLNNDTLLKNDAASILFAFMNQHQETALATAALYRSDGTRTSSYKLFPSLMGKLFGNALSRKIGTVRFPSNKTILQEPANVEVVSGSCMFFRASVFDSLGGFDTHFFLYCEEEDISKRIWNAGYDVYVVPQARVIHHEGASTQKSYAIEKEYYISYHLLIRKHFSLPVALGMDLLLLFKLFRRSFRSVNFLKLFYFVLRGSPFKESLRYQQSIKSFH